MYKFYLFKEAMATPRLAPTNFPKKSNFQFICKNSRNQFFYRDWSLLPCFLAAKPDLCIQDDMTKNFKGGTSRRIYPWNQSKISNLKSIDFWMPWNTIANILTLSPLPTSTICEEQFWHPLILPSITSTATSSVQKAFPSCFNVPKSPKWNSDFLRSNPI